jgi:hypothetical protein
MNQSRLSRMGRRISLFLFSVAIIITSVSIVFARLDIGAYGLIHGLPPTFFVGLFLLTISLLITLRFDIGNKALLSLHLIALVIFLYLLPALIEKTARFAPAYLVYGSTEYVLRQGHIDFSLSGNIGSLYQQWPGMTLLGALVIQITGLGTTGILVGFPVAFELICLPLLYLILNSVIKNQVFVWIALWLYFVAGWINRAYYSGQAYGYLIFLFIVFIVVSSALKRGEIRPVERGTTSIVLVVFFISIAVGHLLSAIVSAVCLVILYALFRIFRVKGTRRFGFIIPVFLLAIVLWLILPSGRSLLESIIARARPSGMGELLNFTAIFRSTFEVPFSYGSEHARIMLLRAAYTGFFCVLAFVGLVYTMIKKRMDLSSLTMLGLLLGACSAVILVGNYGGEIVYRAFEFSLLFLAFFAVKSLGRKALAIPLIIFLLVSPTLFVASAYANEKADYVSPAELRGVDFFYDHTTEYATVHSLWIRIWDYRDIKLSHWALLDLSSVCASDGDNYYLVSERDVDTCQFLGCYSNLTIDQLKGLIESSCRAKIYSSTGFDLYR